MLLRGRALRKPLIGEMSEETYPRVRPQWASLWEGRRPQQKQELAQEIMISQVGFFVNAKLNLQTVAAAVVAGKPVAGSIEAAGADAGEQTC